MQRPSRIVIVIAVLVSVPFVAFALVAGAYIAYSLVTQAWYRNTFAAYGMKLLVLYAVFACGVAAAAALALNDAQRLLRASRIALWAVCLAGVVATVAFELQFWSETDRFVPRGSAFLPFVAWAWVAWQGRRAK